MLSARMASVFRFYFLHAQLIGFFPFGWDSKRDQFLSVSHSDSHLKWWVVHNLVLLFKVGSLLVQVYNLAKEGQFSELVFENLFLQQSLAALVHNWYLWRGRDTLPLVYGRCMAFSRGALGKRKPEKKLTYPLENEGLAGPAIGGMVLTALFSSFVFVLAFSDPFAPPFFANWARPFYGGGRMGMVLRVVLALLESYVTAFCWITNGAIVIFLPNFALFFNHWTGELRMEKGGTGRRRELEGSLQTYRELQLLVSLFNECFAGQIATMSTIAFFNQISVNYATLKLYGELSLASWIVFPYLTIMEANNIRHILDSLAKPLECSKGVIHSWKGKGQRPVYRRVVVGSCPPLRLRHGSVKWVEKAQGIEWVDSMIDATVKVLLWQ